MIQFNLLPDVKLQFIKARRTKRLVTLISLLVSALAIFVLLLSVLTVDVVQKKSLSDLDRDIKSNNAKLEAIPNLDKILTVQNQLNTLTSLHDQKIATPRLFTYIAQLTPNGVDLSNLQADFTQNTFTITGTAPSLDLVNQFIDTLKATNYATYTPDAAGQKQQAADDAYYQAHGQYPAGSNGKSKAFSNVVLSTFGKSSQGATYTITMNFDPAIFANANIAELHVPNGTVSNTNILFTKVGG